MYHIEQLRGKEIADLQSIAQELGIKGFKSLDRDSLIYRILDGQAMQNSKAGAPAVQSPSLTLPFWRKRWKRQRPLS